MGLAGRKVKQRIGADPRNLAWIDDSSKFGEKYLQSLGWSSGQGLGLTGDGRVDNIKIHQKLDLMGIGANRQGHDSNDWKAGREFDRLLSRLNQTQNNSQEPDTHIPSGFEKASNEQLTPQTKKDDSTGEKRKRLPSEEEDTEARRKRKKEKRERKEQKIKEREARKKAAEVKRVGSPVATEESALDKIVSTVRPTLYRAHRKRHLASKRLAASSSQSMKEILGISSTASDASIMPSSTTEFIPTDDKAVKGEKETRDLDTDNLRKSEKSMADYFAEKLRLKTKSS
ncbi:hypothetical protein Clacol_002756 [Clathrus columnatus]|uniref:G-patch domain-containing protein n=1 Tax=Clathrus columnatus TaxID=1419009 RepID=A0AAV5A4Y6_9AGAM|nr:hypothetical protein Clacol_002756 [Clathrus columnatus]